MSGKFMKIRKVCVSTLTLLIVASQLTGCASSTQKEMLDMYNNNQSITIELAEPISQEQGTEVHVEWTELAALDNYEAFRMTVDDALGITAHGENGKNGVLYVDLDGNHTNNSTLFNAFANQKFRDNVWNNSDATKAIIDAAKSIYTDVESDKAALLAGYNAYYNLLNDSEPGYSNMYSTITRLEAMSMIFKADTPVYEIEVNEQFASAVENETLAPYAQELNNCSFLKADNLSLDGNTANGTITRAEFIYMIVQRYFADDYVNVTGKESCYSDAKNGGDVAKEIGLITTDKKTGATTVQNRCESYELSYCVRDEKAGMPEELYKAMVVAHQKGLIAGSECRWLDGLIKGEALTILTNAYNSLETQTNADRGAASGEAITTNVETNTSIDWNSINPKVHAEYIKDANIVNLDATICEYMINNCPAFKGSTIEQVEDSVTRYLIAYYNDKFGDNEWLQFASTGDESVLNLEASDEHEMTAEEIADAEAQMKEKMYKKLAIKLGITVEEAKAMLDKNLNDNSDTTSNAGGGNANSGGNTNGGGGSAPVATPSTKQPNATEDTFVTPELPSGNNGTSNSDPWQGDGTFELGDLGDGGPLTGNVSLNP